ncbi:hypothetical protein D3C80_1313140 [compost metagenome]
MEVVVDANARLDSCRLPAGRLPSIAGRFGGDARGRSESSGAAGVVCTRVLGPRRAELVEEHPATTGRLVKEYRRAAHGAAGIGIDVAVVCARQRTWPPALRSGHEIGKGRMPRMPFPTPAAGAVQWVIPCVAHKHLVVAVVAKRLIFQYVSA